MIEKPDQCPECSSNEVASILYGFPDFSEDLERSLESGEIVLGGCTISDDDPVWHCVECGHEWGAWS
jgi:hypothetical protein